MRAKLIRLQRDDKQTLGHLYVYNGIKKVFECKTLELTWKGNQRRISCIPAGKYNVVKHKSPKFKNSFWIKNVPNRSEILIHRGNFHFDILGCILVGRNHTDINNDGYRDVTSSVATMKQLYEQLPNKFSLHIVE